MSYENVISEVLTTEQDPEADRFRYVRDTARMIYVNRIEESAYTDGVSRRAMVRDCYREALTFTKHIEAIWQEKKSRDEKEKEKE